MRQDCGPPQGYTARARVDSARRRAPRESCDSHAIATSLFIGVVSILPTRRRRYLWAAWWTAPPHAKPFRRPDASHGGAATHEAARAEAERVAGRSLVEIDPRWAGAWNRILRGQDPAPALHGLNHGAAPRAAASAPTTRVLPRGSRPWAYATLALPQGASLAEIVRAFRLAAFRTHPDRGGDEAEFIAVREAYEIALRAPAGPHRRRRRRR